MNEDLNTDTRSNVESNQYQTIAIDFGKSFTLTNNDIATLLAAEKGWQNKYRRIMLLGKELPALPDSIKTDEFLVQGCESNVWITHVWQGDSNNPTLYLAASSDAKIVKGLIAIVLAAFNNKSRQEVAAFDVSAYLQSLMLLDELSASRSNGIKAIIDAIKSY